MKQIQTLQDAIARAIALGFPYAVQAWPLQDGRIDYVVAHGSGDGIGKTVFATIPQK